MTKKDIELLLSIHDEPCVTILVPTHRTMPERQQDPIRVKNAITKAKETLAKRSYERDIAPLFERLDQLVATIDYEKTLDGLAFFVSNDFGALYRLPVSVPEKVEIGTTFVTRDITKAENRATRYLVLSLSEKPTRLYYGVGPRVVEIIEPKIDKWGTHHDSFPLRFVESPHQVSSMLDTVNFSSQYDERQKRQFFGIAAKLLLERVMKEKLPVILMGPEENRSIFLEEYKRPEDIVAQVNGEYSRSTEYDIGPLVWPAVQEYYTQVRQEVLDKFIDALGRQHGAFGLERVWSLANEGRIDTLLVEEGYKAFGGVNENNPADIIVADNGKDDVVNMLVELVQSKGNGHIYFMPEGSLKDYEKVAAILRY